MKSQAVRVWLSLMLVLLAGYGAFTLWRVARANRDSEAAFTKATLVKNSNTPPKDVKIEDFSFTDQRGRRVELKQFKGQIWVASFFFANCPGPCMLMNNAVAKLRSELGDSKLGNGGVTFVSVTVDPLNDTPDRLARYADHFHADPKSWLFLTGPYESARSLGEDLFHVTVVGQSHSERLILVNRDGEVVRTYHATDPLQVAELKQKIEELLAAPTSSRADEKLPVTDKVEPNDAAPVPASPAAKEPS
jgi:protein SCO1/2